MEDLKYGHCTGGFFTKLGFLKFGEKLGVDDVTFCKESPQPFARNDCATNQRFNWLDEEK